MDQDMRDAFDRLKVDNAKLNRMLDDALAEHAKHAGREDIRTVLARIEAAILEVGRILRERGHI